MKFRDMQNEYAKRGYDISRRNGTYTICKQSKRFITSIAYPGTVMTPVQKRYCKQACDEIDIVIKSMDDYITEIIQQDIELANENENNKREEINEKCLQRLHTESNHNRMCP